MVVAAYDDHRYVRLINLETRDIGDWHEMPDDDDRSLCGAALESVTLYRRSLTLSADEVDGQRYQHQRGTSFPQSGTVCGRCHELVSWRGVEGEGQTMLTARRDPSWR